MKYIYITQEEVFWIFTQIIECILPVNFFSQMAGVMIDSTILNKMIQIYIPDLYQFLKVNNYEFFLTNVTYKWFLSLFSQNISENVFKFNLDLFSYLGCFIYR